MPLSVASELSRSERDRTIAFFIFGLSLALFVFSHARGFSIAALSDDIGLIRLFAQHAESGGLGAEIFERLVGPTARAANVSTTMWRPLPFASFGLDALLHGDGVTRWRITNLFLHIGAALAVAWLATSLALPRIAAVIAFGVFLLQPWSPEVTIWIVGRFDAFATLLIVLSLVSAVKSNGSDRWLGASLLFGALAYASKESAVTICAMLVVVLFARDRIRSTNDRKLLSRASINTLFLHGVLLIGYFALRHWLLSAASVNVYQSTGASLDPMKLVRAFAAHLDTAFSFVTISPLSGAVALILCTAAALIAIARRESRAVALAATAISLIVVAALAVAFPTPSVERDGFRVYHLLAVGMALLCAAAYRRTGIALSIAVITLVSLAVWQRAAVEEWRVASNVMYRLHDEIKNLGTRISKSDYALIAVPDAFGRIPFARNAQGGLVLAYAGDRERMTQMILATDYTLRDWKRLSDEGIAKKLAKRAEAPDAPSIFYCFDGVRLVELGFWKSANEADWAKRWSEALTKACPKIVYR